MFVREVNSRLAQRAADVDEHVLEFLSDQELGLESGLSLVALLSLREDAARCATPEILRDCSCVVAALAKGLGELYREYEQAQSDAFRLEAMLRSSIAALEQSNNDLRAELDQQETRYERLELQLKTNAELYHRRMAKVREHLVEAGIFNQASSPSVFSENEPPLQAGVRRKLSRASSQGPRRRSEFEQAAALRAPADHGRARA